MMSALQLLALGIQLIGGPVIAEDPFEVGQQLLNEVVAATQDRLAPVARASGHFNRVAEPFPDPAASPPELVGPYTTEQCVGRRHWRPPGRWVQTGGPDRVTRPAD